ncbi:MAG: preprotein translocase subunit SecA [Phycisphaerales bacterium]|nr:preprotein translocase subunit SecA [Phycisphaerales bacterium]MCB9835706.1 preprotein translocase subunit SecA [Phycisphaera sp.]
MQTEKGIPVVGPILNKIIGTRNERFVKRYTSRVERINAIEAEISALTDAQLRAKRAEFSDRLKKGESEDNVMIEAIAVAREVMDRNVGIRNALNPESGFDASRLTGEARGWYDKAVADMASMEPAQPQGDFQGCAEPTPAWRFVEVPVGFYAAIRELYPESRPPFRARPFDVQLIGSMVLSQGKIAEMKTGEGKTIVAPLAAYWACVKGEKVHVVTVNDYLVQRDRDWTFPFFYGAGMTVGAIHPQHMQPEPAKRVMYMCDVVYGTTSEFGFDYLRDNMKRNVNQQVQRRRDFAIVDEVDSVLIDEARTPLIISGAAHENQPRYDLADRLASELLEKQRPWQEQEDKVQHTLERIKGLEGDIRQAKDKSRVPEMQKQLEEIKKDLPGLESARDQHVQYYEIQMDRKQVHLTHDGIATAQRSAGVGSFYVGENTDIPHLLEQALRAHAVYQRDKDYVIMNLPSQMTGRPEPTIVIVDTFTGRPMVGRQWSDGLHQAIECKERVPIKQETQTVATITIQNFFKMYKRLSGMTGTADTEAQEFHDIYHLDVVSIPTNRPVVRHDYDDLMFLREKDKWEAIVDEIKSFHDAGRPILVGTTSVEKSERLGQMLTRKYGIKHEVLNAKQHEREAHIVENAGQIGAVMIATNMAGRGTDIKLGRFTREELLEHWLKRGIAARGLTPESTEDEVRENVYRKIAPSELGIQKREAESMDYPALELELLRHWARKYTWLSDGKGMFAGKGVASLSRDELIQELDATGRCLLHRIGWYDTIESLGGLHVIGTERHESRRIDNQLRGRSGRQGDNGSSRFFVSLEDDLMKMFAGETTMRILSRLGMKEGDAIEHPILSKSVEKAQRKIEERNFQGRKNILEYDEVMEHQRQRFYGIRQRALESRDVKVLILEYIDECIDDACAEYLSKDYPARCAADLAREKLETLIAVERLRGKDREEMEKRIREDAKYEARSMIDVTLGEYISAEGSEVVVDFDSAGLVSWAKNRFGIDIDVAELAEADQASRRAVQERLVYAAEKQVDDADLGKIAEFVDPDYGIDRLVSWAKSKFGIESHRDEIRQAIESGEETPQMKLKERARKRYQMREVEYPIDYALAMTVMGMRTSPQESLDALISWSKMRYDLELDADAVRQAGPSKMKEQLEGGIKAWFERDELGKALDEISACKDVEAVEAYLQKRFSGKAPDWLGWLDQEEFHQASRGLVEARLRPEMLQLEQTVLLDTLDQSWKDHLYAMDQLRDGINYQAFAQQDPKIAYKKQGAELFREMLTDVQERVAEYVYKARINPAANMPPPQQAPRPQPVGAGAGGGGGGFFGSSIAGPGFASAPTPPRPPANPPAGGNPGGGEGGQA